MWSQSEIKRLNEAIYHRKSVKKFKQEPLSSETLHEIKQKAEQLTALHPESKMVFRMLDSSQVKGKSTGTVHYLAAYADRGLEPYVNAAFMLQQMDLWLSAQGIGSWWRGIHPTPQFETADGLPYVFMLTFGAADGEPHRTESSEFKRKPLGDISDIRGMEPILESVRLAPSATNRQPWHITGDAHSMRLHGKKDGVLLSAMFKDLMYMDVGIALCHLWLAAMKENKFLSFEREPGQGSISEKHEYIWTVHLKP